MFSYRCAAAFLVLGALPLLAAGCGGGSPMGGPTGSGGAGGRDAGAGGRVTGPDAAGPVDIGPPVNPTAGPCTPVITSHPDEGAVHIEQCSQAVYLTNPPSSGNHYPTWPMYRIYDKPVPWGFLVHGLEHGGIVISYRCDAGCAAQVDKLRTFIATIPQDTTCLAPKKIIVVPDPGLDVAFAASAWTWTLRADCFDTDALGKFITEHYGMTAEAGVCSHGPDLSTTGWCPAQ